jgi:N-acetylglutamate synthase-like GNAT family acetyltransferase
MKKRDKINEYHYLFRVVLKNLGIQLNALELKEVRQCQGSILGCCTIYSNLWPDAHLLVTVAAAPPWVLAGFGESIFLI